MPETNGPPAPANPPQALITIVVLPSGRLQWTGLTDEISARGWLDKIRDTIIETMRERSHSVVAAARL